MGNYSKKKNEYFQIILLNLFYNLPEKLLVVLFLRNPMELLVTHEYFQNKNNNSLYLPLLILKYMAFQNIFILGSTGNV